MTTHKHTIETAGQLSGHDISDSTLQGNSLQSIGTLQELGLLAIAIAEDSNPQNFAQKAIEILLDDMSLNLKTDTPSPRKSHHLISSCLHESIENINEYLIEQHTLLKNTAQHGLSLSIVHLHPQGINCCSIGSINCLKINQNGLTPLNTATSNTDKLGLIPSLNITITEETLNHDDIIFIAPYKLIEQLGHDFIRMTLLRFATNLYMAKRQINARLNKHKQPANPTFLICKKVTPDKAPKSWLKRF